MAALTVTVAHAVNCTESLPTVRVLNTNRAVRVMPMLIYRWLVNDNQRKIDG